MGCLAPFREDVMTCGSEGVAPGWSKAILGLQAIVGTRHLGEIEARPWRRAAVEILGPWPPEKHGNLRLERASAREHLQPTIRGYQVVVAVLLSSRTSVTSCDQPHYDEFARFPFEALPILFPGRFQNERIRKGGRKIRTQGYRWC